MIRQSMLGCAVLLMGWAESSVADHYVTARVSYVVADNGLQGEKFSESIDPGQGRVRAELSAEYAYPCGNSVEGRVSAALEEASLQTYAHAEYADPNVYWETRTIALASLLETLSFTLEPGEYLDGAVVRVRSRVTGSLADTGGASGTFAQMLYVTSFSGVEEELEAHSSSTNAVDEIVEVSNRLITPGTILQHPLEVQNVAVFARLVTTAQVLRSDTAEATAEFWGGARILDIDTPAGVGWTSDSGLFLEIPGDFDGNGGVDGVDFLTWQRGDLPAPYSAADLADWEGNFGLPAPPAAQTESAEVPEPATAVLLTGAMGIVWVLGRRDRIDRTGRMGFAEDWRDRIGQGQRDGRGGSGQDRQE